MLYSWSCSQLSPRRSRGFGCSFNPASAFWCIRPSELLDPFLYGFEEIGSRRRSAERPEAGLPLMNAPPTPSRPRHVQLDPATLRPSKPTSVRKGEPAKGGNDAVAPPLPTNLSAFKANSGPFTSDIPPSRPARTDSFPAKNGAGQGWKVENNRNVIVEAGHHLRKMQAHCSWLHLFTHARWLHAGLSLSKIRWPDYP